MFTYLAEHHATLPDFVVFVHPDSQEHQTAEFPALRAALELLSSDSELANTSLQSSRWVQHQHQHQHHHELPVNIEYPTLAPTRQFFPLAHQYLVTPRRTRHPGFLALWREVFPHGPPPPTNISFYASCQAVVSKHRVLQHSPAFYLRLARVAERMGPPEFEVQPGWLEAMFHVIFGEAHEAVLSARS